MKVSFVDLEALHRPILGELERAVGRVMTRGDFVLGEEVERFEEEFARYCGARFGIGVDSGLSALELSLRALGIGPGDEVIVPALTYIATAAAVSFTGAEPVFADIDPVTFCLDAECVEAAISPRTRAIIPVHLYGLPADMDAMMRMARRHGLQVIEDAAQAHGATFKGRKVGSLGHAAAFSFYPTKNLGGLGDGGMVVTDDERIAENVRMLRNCGQRRKNWHEMPPFNHRLDSIQAAGLRVKLRYLNRWNEIRRSVAAQYDALLNRRTLVPPLQAEDRMHVYHTYVIRSSNRSVLRARLDHAEIGTSIYYPTPPHRQPFYDYKNLPWGRYPVAEQACREVLSLPMHPALSPSQTKFVSAKVNESSRDARPLYDLDGFSYPTSASVPATAFAFDGAIEQ